jgi:hypothetical protein
MAARKPTVSQVLPSARIIPKLTVSEDLKSRLTEMASKAYRRMHGDFDMETFAVSMAPIRAQSAAQHYVSEKEFEMELPTFRRVLRDGDLRKAIDALSGVLGSDTLPPFAQMRSLFCYGDPCSNDLEDASSEQTKQRQRREDLWDPKFSAARLGELLGQWQSLMNELRRLAGSGRTPIVAKCTFCTCAGALLDGRA